MIVFFSFLLRLSYKCDDDYYFKFWFCHFFQQTKNKMWWSFWSVFVSSLPCVIRLLLFWQTGFGQYFWNVFFFFCFCFCFVFNYRWLFSLFFCFKTFISRLVSLCFLLLFSQFFFDVFFSFTNWKHVSSITQWIMNLWTLIQKISATIRSDIQIMLTSCFLWLRQVLDIKVQD